MPYRVASPPEPDPPEVEEPYAAVLRAQAKRTRNAALGTLVTIAALALLGRLVGSFASAPRGSPPAGDSSDAIRRAEAEVAVAQTRAAMAVAQSRFEAAVRSAARARVDGRAERGACPVALPERPPNAIAAAPFPMRLVREDELDATVPSEAIAEVLRDLGRAERHLEARRYEDAALYARALTRPDRLAYEVVVVTSTMTEPSVLRPDAFEPGEIDGRAYLYDFASGRVVCAGEIHASSSRNVGYVYDDRVGAASTSSEKTQRLSRTLRDDLRFELARAVAGGVRYRTPD